MKVPNLLQHLLLEPKPKSLLSNLLPNGWRGAEENDEINLIT